MFETSHVVSRVAAQQRVGLLTVSLAIHSAVVVAVVVTTLSSLRLPTHPPNDLPRYLEPVRVTIPPPLGVRAAARPAQPAQRPAQASAPRTNVAPEHIPDAVQPFSAPANANTNTIGNDDAAPDDVGDPDGVIGGINVGPSQRVEPAEPPDRVYQPVGEVRPAVVLHRVEPIYPRAALLAHISGVVVIECVVDKEGHVRDSRVVSSSFAIFDEPALTALRQWKFAPGALRGKPVDTWFQLTVAFQPVGR